LIPKEWSSKQGWYFVFGFAICLGIGFRFTNLDGKFFWWDETATSLRVSGNYWNDVEAWTPKGKRFSAEIVLGRFQGLSGTSFDTLRGLQKEEPQLTPLYFLLARAWAVPFGTSVVSLRAFSAVTSVASLGVFFWLSLLLFASFATALTATAVAALSPLNLIYAQEARPYALLVFFTLLSSVILLVGISSRKRRLTLAYLLTAIAGIYTHLLFLLVPLTHFAYLFANRASLHPRDLRRYGIAIALSLLSVIPWLVIIATNYPQFEKTVGWTTLSLNFYELVAAWGGQMIWPLFDIGLKEDPRTQLGQLVPTTLVFLPLAIVSIAFTAKQAARRTWTFPLLLLLIAFAPLAIPDVILGGQRTTVPRYLLSFHLGILLCVGFFLTHYAGRARGPITFALLLAQIWSCQLILRSENWWHKGFVNHAKVRAVAAELLTEERHLVVVASPMPELLSLSRVKPERTEFLVDNEAFTATSLLAAQTNPTLGIGRVERFGNFVVYSGPLEAPLPSVADFRAPQ